MNLAKYENYRDQVSEVLISENTNNMFEAHFHRNVELLYVKSGEMAATINDKTYVYAADEIVYVPSYYAHEFTTPEASDVIVLQIPSDLMCDFNETFHNKTFFSKLSNPVVNRKVLEILLLMIRNIDITNDFILKGYVNIIIGLLYESYPMEDVCILRSTNIIVSMLNYIDTHYAENLTLDSISRVFGYNKFYVSKLFNQCVKDNFKSYINSIRIKNVISAHMKNPAANITTLALQCGFDSVSSFYRVFKSIYNKNPKAFFKSPYNNSVSLNHYAYNTITLSYKGKPE